MQATDTPAPVVVAAPTALAEAAIARPPGIVARHLVEARCADRRGAARSPTARSSAEPLLLALLASRDAAVAEAAADASAGGHSWQRRAAQAWPRPTTAEPSPAHADWPSRCSRATATGAGWRVASDAGGVTLPS
ncbi:MAG: hypothetical protein R3F60_27360 [bacterium]